MPEPPTLADVYALIRKLPSDSLWQFWQELASCIGHEFLRAHFCGKAGETVTLYVSKRETSATLWFARGKGPPLGGRTHWLCAGYKVCFVEPEDVDIANDAPSLPRKRLAGESISLPVYIPRHHLPYFLYLQLHLCLFARELNKNRNVKPRKRNRDANIVLLRESNSKHWTWQRLARHFSIKPQTARMAYLRFKRTNPTPIPSSIADCCK